MNEGQQTIKKDQEVIDKKRVFIALLLFAVILGGAVFWGKETGPRLTQRFKDITAVRQQNAGEVAGSSDTKAEFKEQRQELQNKIDEIKTGVTKLKPEDIKEQVPVKKILSDLDDLAKQASESTKFLDIKGNICEEAKRRFCQ